MAMTHSCMVGLIWQPDRSLRAVAQWPEYLVLPGATPTMPSVAWSALRYGVKPELYALSSIINIMVFAAIAVLYFVARSDRKRPME
ncbi:hypothetical protein EOB49_11080 [Mesorhizobium sp. M7A.F.Ca.MR.148.00.0.0]|nr:hypothetical protein EOB49_11080 [Mesorhizobium sp. M7A.F.Ca.MR.148.00.0.0]